MRGLGGFHSLSRVNQPPLTLCGKRETCSQVPDVQFREVCQDFLLGHSACKAVKNVIDGNPQPTTAGLSAALVGFDGYS